MNSIPKYFQLIRHISNWPVYFKRKHEMNKTATYITRGRLLSFEVPPLYYHVFREIFMEDFYKISELASSLPQQPVVVDIGGNVGFFSFALAAKKKQVKIYAFEPMRENIAVFQKNIKCNHGLGNEILVFEKAVTGNYEGSIELFFDNINDNSIVASVLNDFSSENTASRQVEAISLEKILSDNHIEKIDLLKVDCEGSEYPIFYESPPDIFDHIQQIAIETHDLDTSDRNTASLARFLEQKGYAVTQYQQENHCYYLKAYRK